MRISLSLFIVFSIVVSLLLVPAPAGSAEAADQVWLEQAGTPEGLLSLKQQVSKLEQEYRDNLQVRGIYVPGNLVPTEMFPRLIQLVDRTELNAVVIDVKSDEGYIYYDSELPLVAEIGAQRLRIKNGDKLLGSLKEKGIYLIARLVVFKDSQLGKGKPEWSIHDSAGVPWRDRTGQIWMDAYNENVWQYNIDVACEAIRLGFDEVQFDYVRFPSDGRVKDAMYQQQDDRHKSVVIGQFLAEAADQLDLHGGYSSADIFGQIPSVADDMGIGQQWELLAGAVDYLSPMAYPSHYGPNVYGIPNPDADPYRTVLNTVEDAQEKFDKLLYNGPSERLVNRVGEVPPELRVTSRGQLAEVRPWLQDFSLRMRYGAAEVRDQIEAVYEAGAQEWLLWNPSGRYTEAALKPSSE